MKYCSLWPGHIRCVMRKSNQDTPDFGLIKLDEKDLRFKLKIVGSCKEISTTHLIGANTVLASADNQELLHISSLCQQEGIRCIYIIEYTLKTRLQIVTLNAPSLLHRLKRSFSALLQESRRLKAFSIADGIQANGVPSFNKYASETKDNLLYLDNRVKPNEIITQVELNQRIEYLKLKRPLRLAFSGRLTKIKGANDLVKVAELLERVGVKFVMSIYGTGDLITCMKTQIDDKKLSNKVILKGSVDFHSALLPALKENTDLFICLHKQGDPSCTYIETLACGVPIVGYANEAFIGLLSKKDIGWSAPINDTETIVETIVHLDRNRHLLETKAQASIALAKDNDFETTFRRRIQHLKKNSS
jgi:glycosyltransferase involved in cell wall biosynthesis